jgi:Flp pilus assembly protein TadG
MRLLIAFRHRQAERGAAMLEVALTLPILLLVCVGILEFGRAYQTWQVLTNAAREGARVAVLPDATTTGVEDRVKNYMKAGRLAKWDDADIDWDGNATINIGATTATASVVTIDYPFEFMVLSGVAKLVTSSSTIGGDITMSASAEMRNETQ